MRHHLSVRMTKLRSLWMLKQHDVSDDRWDFAVGRGSSPGLKVRKVGAHLVATAILCPRLDGSIV